MPEPAPEHRKPAFHQSILTGLAKCAMQVRHRYIDGRKVPPGVAQVKGTVVHAVIDEDLIEKVKTGEQLPIEAVRDIARDRLLATWDGEEPMLDEDEQKQGKEAVKAEAIDEVVGLAELSSRELVPQKRPVSVAHIERRLRATFDGFPFDLEGTIDLEEAGGKITDFKTAERSPPDDEADGNIQLDVYSLMKQVADGKGPETVGVNTLVKTTKPKLVIVEAPAAKDFAHVALRLEHAAKVFEADAFYPVAPHGPNGWVCSPRFCGYWDSICPFGRRARASFQVLQAAAQEGGA